MQKTKQNSTLRIFFFLLIFFESQLFAQRLSHTSNDQILEDISVSCNEKGVHFQNSYYRVFDLTNSFKIETDWLLESVEFAVLKAQSGKQTGQQAKLILYVMSSYQSPRLLQDSLIQLTDTIDVTIEDSDSGTLKKVSMPSPLKISQGKVLVVELLIPDGQAEGNILFLGGNTFPEKDVAYIKAEECSLPEPAPLSVIGFADVHLILNVYGSPL
ncbi:MAG: hypothetical protein CSB06_03015 [Bacteroidia bacterium]|nr:MAG: hypothetical protein CSB06_03015 [Bacteroidia bacterium]